MFLLSRVTDSLTAGSFAAVCRLAAGDEDRSPAQVHVGHHLAHVTILIGELGTPDSESMGSPWPSMATGHRQVLQRPLLQRGTQGPRDPGDPKGELLGSWVFS